MQVLGAFKRSEHVGRDISVQNKITHLFCIRTFTTVLYINIVNYLLLHFILLVKCTFINISRTQSFFVEIGTTLDKSDNYFIKCCRNPT